MFRSTLFLASLCAFAPLSSAQQGFVTVIHGIPGLPAPVDVLADGNKLFSFDYCDVRGPLALPPGSYFLEVQLQGSTVLSLNATVEADTNYTVVAHTEPGGGIKLSAFVDDVTRTGRASSRLIVRHLADAPPVDVIAQPVGGPKLTLFGNVSNPGEGVVVVGTGSYDVSLEAAGSGQTAFGPLRVTLDGNTAYAVHALGVLGTPSFKLLINAIDLPELPALKTTIDGVACGGAIGTSTPTPRFGRSFDVTLSNATPNGVGLLHVGLDDEGVFYFRQLPLPLRLDVLGLTGCSLYLNPIATLPVSIDANGAASSSVRIPVSAAGMFDEARFQFSFLAPGANPAGLVLTDFVTVEK